MTSPATRLFVKAHIRHDRGRINGLHHVDQREGGDRHAPLQHTEHCPKCRVDRPKVNRAQ